MIDSLIVLAFFVIGILVGIGGAVPMDYLPAELSEWLLYALVIEIGISLGYGGNLRKIVKEISWRSLLLPVSTIIFTLLFTLLAGYCIGGLNTSDWLALGSGLGYYSLSSVIIIDLKSSQIGLQAATQLGMLALLVNIIREMTALICGPWFGKVFGRLAATAAAGVTSMDVCLPMIVRCTGPEIIPTAVLHGMVLEISVPLLVTFFAGL